jgi:hypothetical protein
VPTTDSCTATSTAQKEDGLTAVSPKINIKAGGTRLTRTSLDQSTPTKNSMWIYFSTLCVFSFSILGVCGVIGLVVLSERVTGVNGAPEAAA